MKHTLIKMFASLVFLFGIMLGIVAVCSAQMCKPAPNRILLPAYNVNTHNGGETLLPYDPTPINDFVKRHLNYDVQSLYYVFTSGRANVKITTDLLYSKICGTGYMHYTEFVETDGIERVNLLPPAKICINDNLDAIICIPYIDTLILQKHK